MDDKFHLQIHKSIIVHSHLLQDLVSKQTESTGANHIFLA
jgi:hypothetical protein